MKNNITTKNSVSFQNINKTAASSKSNAKKEQPQIQTSSSKENLPNPSVIEENKSTIPPSKSLYSNARQEKKKKEKSIEEEIMEKEISTLEKTHLNRAFDILCGKDLPKNETEYGNKEKTKNDDDKINFDETEKHPSFNAKDVMRVLDKLNYKLSKPEVDLMIWVFFSFYFSIK